MRTSKKHDRKKERNEEKEQETGKFCGYVHILSDLNQWFMIDIVTKETTKRFGRLNDPCGNGADWAWESSLKHFVFTNKAFCKIKYGSVLNWRTATAPKDISFYHAIWKNRRKLFTLGSFAGAWTWRLVSTWTGAFSDGGERRSNLILWNQFAYVRCDVIIVWNLFTKE